MLEAKYQGDLIKRIKRKWPGCLVFKNDTRYIQGILDLTVLFPGGGWALLEVKVSEDAARQPNQDYYVELANEMFYGSFIWPEIEDEVLDEIQQALYSRGTARSPQC